MKKEVSAKVKDGILKNAFKKLETYREEGKGLDKYSVDLKYWLESQPEVTNVTLRGQNTITVEFEDSTQVGILLDRMNMYGGRGAYDDRYLPSRPSVPDPIDLIKSPLERSWVIRTPNTPGTKKALLFDPLYDDWPPDATTDSIEQSLKGAGYTVDKILSNDADLAHLDTIESKQYGVIFIRAHGGVLNVNGNDMTHIMVRPFFDSYPSPSASGYTGIGVFYVSTNWGPKYTYAFNSEYVRHHLATANFPNTLMHLLVCHGGDPLGQDDMIDAFIDLKVGCYTGWTRNASSTHGDPAAVEFFKYLCGGYGRTVVKAIQHIQSLGHSPDSGTGAELVYYGSYTLALLGYPKIIIKIPQKDVLILKKFPKEIVEIIVERPPGIKIPDWSPWGGKLLPVDQEGVRRFVPNSDLESIFDLEELMG